MFEFVFLSQHIYGKILNSLGILKFCRRKYASIFFLTCFYIAIKSFWNVFVCNINLFRLIGVSIFLRVSFPWEVFVSSFIVDTVTFLSTAYPERHTFALLQGLGDPFKASVGMPCIQGVNWSHTLCSVTAQCERQSQM